MPRIEGLSNVLKNLRYEASSIDSYLKNEIQNTGLDILNDAKTNVPVDTGTLRNSGKYERTNEGYGAKVSFSVEYAPYIEFGTGGSVLVPNGWEEVAIQFKGKGLKTINLPARPFLIPSFQKNGMLLKLRLEEKLRNVRNV